MRAIVTVLLVLFVGTVPLYAQTDGDGALAQQYADVAGRIIGTTLVKNDAWDNLSYLGDYFGHRLSGSSQLEAAIDWAVVTMKRYGFENVRKEKVMVPHWVRGEEHIEMLEPAHHKMVMLGLGGSVGTPPEGITAPVVVVTSFDELEALGADKVRGKIVLYNVPFTTYGETVQYRVNGASRAAKLGAVASLVRSVGPVSLRTPHTGGMRYAKDIPKIPTAAVTIEDAERMHRIFRRGDTVKVRLKMGARTLPDAESYNVIGELRGREKPEEIVVIGGHFDSWDVGAGMTDDGGGCITAMEAVNVLKRLGLRPRRTIRVVFFVNEENGLRGGKGYLDAHRDEIKNHVVAIESDAGIDRPLGFGVGVKDSLIKEQALATARDIATLLRGIEADQIRVGGGGADIGPLMGEGVPGMGLNPVTDHYFDLHHTPADTIDKIKPVNLSLHVAVMAVMAYVLADMPQRFGY